MARITFRTDNAATVYLSMAEGMLEVREDDNADADVQALASLIDLCCATANTTASWFLSVELPDSLVEMAEAVLENCIDNSSGYKPGDEDAGDDFLFAGDVTVEA